ncbi:hypothetical protein JXO52_06510 [bacterium]|nr:hypothetical protein [bacterium]
MKKAAGIACVILGAGLLTSSVHGQTLDDRLTLLTPLINKTWEAPMPEIGEGVIRHVRWDVINDGNAVKQITEIEKIGFRTEALFFWDSENAAIGVFSLSSNGNFFRGHVREEGGKILTTGYAVFPDLKLEFRNTFEFTELGTCIDRWFTFRENEWKPGHVFELSELK